MTTHDRPVLLVVDVSDGGRPDQRFHDTLDTLTRRVVAAAETVGFTARRIAAEQLGTEGVLAAAADADAVVVTGGEDVAPEHYDGAADYPGRGQHFRAADAAQVALVRHAVAVALPTVGICRGMQVVNVALGGDLVQHIEHGGHVRPAPDVDGSDMVDHDVEVTRGSALAAALGTTRLVVRSSHHQAVGRLGAGLVAVATAPDGTVEAVEHRSAPLWAVQWHPEDGGASGDDLLDLLRAAHAAATADPRPR